MYRFLLYTLAVLTPWLIGMFGVINYYSDYVRTRFQSDDIGSFDFIVVGSGAGGAVVAKRLSTNKNTRVLLLEAGGDPSYLNHIPGLALDLTGYKYTDWRHLTVSQKHACWGLENNQSSWNAGKVLGGSTTLNFMFYLRGHPLDYDNWAKYTGDKEWSYENVLPYFRNSIKTYNGGFSDNKKHYSESEYGFLNIEGRPWAPLQKEYFDAGKEFGFPTMDVNGGSQKTSFGTIETNQKNGWRFGTYLGIITELEKKPNVKVSRFSEVIKVKFDKNLRAEGVWYLHHGVKKFARASKEVVLSAGAVNSPKLLMLSGIGDRKHLESFKIKVRKDLPVGKNLQDHIVAPIMPFVIDKPISFQAERDFGPGAVLQYLTSGQGPLTTPNAVHSQMFYSSSKVRQESKVDWPDFQGFFASAGMFQIFSDIFSRATRIRLDSLRPVIDHHAGKDGFLFLAGLVRPKSRGEILLRSKNPLEPPLIDPKYLSHPDDIASMVDGIKKMMEVFEKSKSFKSMNAHLPLTPIPNCKQHKMKSDAYWECFARTWTLSIWHPAGSCKMGRGQEDKTAVLDSKLRVLGTIGLRVADASIMPEIVNANTMAPSMLIGEKASQFIREYWSTQFQVSDRKNYYLLKNSKKRFYSQLI